MENSNSREYLEKIKSAVIDNLRQTGPAPSVQLQDVPRRPFGGMTDEEEAELDDFDEDENKDVRMTEHRWDKHVRNDAEFEASDDEDMSAANGLTRQNGNKRTFNDFRKGETDVESGNATPRNDKSDEAAKEQAEDDAHDVNDDTIEDVAATVEVEMEKEVSREEEPEEPEEAKEPEEPKEPEGPKVDDDGDVGMTDSAPTEEATIKREEVEPERAPEPKPDEKTTEKPAVEARLAKAEAEATEAPAAKPKPADTEPEKTENPTETIEAKEVDVQPADAMEVDQDKEKENENESEKDKATDEKEASPANAS